MIKPEMFNYKDADSFYLRTVNMESASDYDAYIRTNGVRTKSVLVKNKSSDRRFMYVVEDVLCFAAYNKVKVDPQKRDFIKELWERCRQGDDFFHSFYDDFTKDYTISEIRGQKVECVSFHLLPAIVYTAINFLDNELLNPDTDIICYTNKCQYKCCKASATKEDRIREYSERKYKKLSLIEQMIKDSKEVKKEPEVKKKLQLLTRVKWYINSFF